MITIKNYVRVNSLEEAYELNQKRANRVAGGMMWMRMSTANVQTLIDLSGLQLDQIEETDEQFQIGCMCSLRDLETHKGLNDWFCGAFKDSVKHIVGVQFRNGATIGGSIFGRFGFSDILTLLLSLDSYVKLYHKGIIPMQEFVLQERDNDILEKIIVKKTRRNVVYSSQRIAKTDFPVLTCAVSKEGETLWISVGARPMKAAFAALTMPEGLSLEESANQIGEQVCEDMKFGTNMRGSAAYRKHLAQVQVKRAVLALYEKEQEEA